MDTELHSSTPFHRNKRFNDWFSKSTHCNTILNMII